MAESLLKLIDRCRQNDRKAQSALYEKSFESLMRICARYCANRADALALLNEGFLKILLALDQFDGQRSWSAWANTIMLRTAIDRYRREAPHRENTSYLDHDEQLERADLNRAQSQVVDQLSAEDVRQLLFQLPTRERMVFSLFEWEGYSHTEIAQELSISTRSSKRYLAAAKILLRQKIDQLGNLKKVI